MDFWFLLVLNGGWGLAEHEDTTARRSEEGGEGGTGERRSWGEREGGGLGGGDCRGAAENRY